MKSIVKTQGQPPVTMLRAGLRTHLFFTRCPGTSWKLKVTLLPCLSKSVFIELTCSCRGHQCLLAVSPFCISWLNCCCLAQTPGEYSGEAGQLLVGAKAMSLVLKPLDDIFQVWRFQFILLLLRKKDNTIPGLVAPLKFVVVFPGLFC